MDPITIAGELAAAFREDAAENDRTAALPQRNLEMARSSGVLGLTVPAALGGWGAGLATFSRYQERLARGDGSTALVLAMHHMLIGGEAEAGLWPEPLFTEICRAALDSGALVNAAATEPDAGSPSQGGLPATRAEAAGEGFRLQGRKAYTTGAGALSFLRVAATVEGDGEPYSARFLVRMPAPGLTILEDWDSVALRASRGDTIVLEGVPATFLYREDARGCEGNVWFQVAIAATYLGIGQAAQDAGRDYAARRRPRALERPISDLDSVRIRLGRSRAALMVARRNLFATCDEWERLPARERETLVTSFALAKVVAVNAAADAADAAMRLAGGAGLSPALPFARYLRDTRPGLAHPPVDDVAYLALAAEELEGLE